MSKGRNDRLRQEREKRGWSQARVAEQIATDAANVSRWERGYATPSPYYREKLCLLFDTTAQALGFFSNEPAGVEQSPALLLGSTSEQARLQESVQSQQKYAPQRAPVRTSRHLAAVGYLFGWVSGLFLVLLVRERFVRYHSLQSTLFFGASNVLSLVMLVFWAWLAFLKRNVSNAPHLFGGLFATLLVPLTVIEMALVLLLVLLITFTSIVWVVGMWQAWQGRSYPLPFVASLSENMTSRLQRNVPGKFLVSGDF